MGVLPLIFKEGENAESLGLDGSETYFIEGIEGIEPRMTLHKRAVKTDGSDIHFEVTARLDTEVDLDYFSHGGILPYVLRKLVS
jgi:aconitate hydratase